MLYDFTHFPDLPNAACASSDPDPAFFPPSGALGVKVSDAAKEVCAGCPERVACLDYALDIERGESAKMRTGIWGGLTPTERHAPRRGGGRMSATTKPPLCDDCRTAYNAHQAATRPSRAKSTASTPLIEDAEFLANTGETWERACQRLGRTPGGLEKSLQKAGRHDLLARLKAT